MIWTKERKCFPFSIKSNSNEPAVYLMQPPRTLHHAAFRAAADSAGSKADCFSMASPEPCSLQTEKTVTLFDHKTMSSF